MKVTNAGCVRNFISTIRPSERFRISAFLGLTICVLSLFCLSVFAAQPDLAEKPPLVAAKTNALKLTAKGLGHPNDVSDSAHNSKQLTFTTEASPAGDTYSLAPQVEDDEFTYVLTPTEDAVTVTFDQVEKELGPNPLGSEGGTFVVLDALFDEEDGTQYVAVQVQAVDAEGVREPWVSADFAGEGFNAWRLDVGAAFGGTNAIELDKPFEVVDSGIALFNSSGESLGDFELTEDNSDSTSLSGVSLIYLEDSADIAGFDLSVMYMWWKIRELPDEVTQITGRHSGSWYNPDRNYEGFEFQVLENGDFLIIFYTYPGPTDDELAEQSFILGVGTLEGNIATIVDAYRTKGPVFGEGYDKDDLVIDTWGDFTVEFFDDNTARVDYVGADGSGSTDVKRLTTLAEGDNGGSLPSGMSAIWYDPETNGQGWFVEILSPSQALVYWFTYDSNGNQVWNLGVGEISGNTILVGESLAGRGSRFGDEFDTNNVTLDLFAGFALEFFDCDNGTVQYFAIDGPITGALPIRRLTRLKGLTCEDELSKPVQGQLTMMTNATDPVLSRYKAPDNSIIDQLGTRDADGNATDETGAEITMANGDKYILNLARDNNSFSIQPLERKGVVLSGKRDGEDLQLIARDIETGSTASALIKIPADEAAALQSGSKKLGDKLQLEAAKHPYQLQNASTEAFVTVSHCGDLTNDANVTFYVADNAQITDPLRPWMAKDSVPIPAQPFSETLGDYSAKLMESSAKEIGDVAAQAACGDFYYEQFCNSYWKGISPIPDPTGKIPIPEASNYICLGIGTAVSLALSPAAGLIAFNACKLAEKAGDLTCLDQKLGGPGRKSLCENVPGLFRDPTGLIVDLEIWAVGNMNNSGDYGLVGPEDFPEIGESVLLPDMKIPAEPVLVNPVTTPKLPVAGDSYELTLTTSCTEPNDVFKIQQFAGFFPYGNELDCVIKEKNGTCTVTHNTKPNWFVERNGEQVGISDFAVTSPWGKVSLHTINLQSLAAPEPVSPASETETQPNNCNADNSITWNFTWTEVEGAKSYNLEISHPDYDSILETGLVADDTNADPSNNSVLQYELLLDGQEVFPTESLEGWTWRVQAVSESGVKSAWSVPSQFSVESCGILSRPTLISPIGESVTLPNKCGDEDVTWGFEWSTVTDGYSYGIEVSNFGIYTGSAAPGNPEILPPNSDVESITFDVTWSEPVQDDQLKNWVWRVWAKDAEGNSSPQPDAEQSFQVASCDDAELDLTGSWQLSNVVDASDCDEGIYPEGYVANITQTGNSVQVCALGRCLNGSISGNSVEWSGSFPEDGGTTTANVNATVSEDFNSFSGISNWTWVNGNNTYSCSGTTQVSAARK